MEVMGELKNAALETKATADMVGSDSIAGKVSFDTTLKRVAVGNGTSIDTIPLLADIATLRDLMHAIGDIVPSVLGKSDFQAQYSDNWLRLDGYGLYNGDGLPPLASDYPELAALFPRWVVDATFSGYARDMYVLIPDMRSCALVGAEDGGHRQGALALKAEISSLLLGAMASTNLEAPLVTPVGFTAQAAVPLQTSAINGGRALTSANLIAQTSNFDFEHGDENNRLKLVTSSEALVSTVDPAPNGGSYVLGETPRPQRLAVNFYIKARESA